MVYIHRQKAGSSRNNICIGLSFELTVRRVAASNTPAFFFFARIMGNLGPCGRNFVRSSTVVHSLTKFLAKPDIASYSAQKKLSVWFGSGGLSPLVGLHPTPRSVQSAGVLFGRALRAVALGGVAPHTPQCAVCGRSVCMRAGMVVQSAGVLFGMALAGCRPWWGCTPHPAACSLRAFCLGWLWRAVALGGASPHTPQCAVCGRSVCMQAFL